MSGASNLNPTSLESQGRVGLIERQIQWLEALVDDGGTKEVDLR